MALSRHQIHYGGSCGESHLSSDRGPQINACPLSALGRQNDNTYLTLDSYRYTFQAPDVPALSRLLTDIGSMNGTVPLSGSFHPEPSRYPGHKLLTTHSTADGQPRVSPPHSHSNLNLPRLPCSESGSKPIRHNLALDCTDWSPQSSENSSGRSTITTTTTTTILHTSQSSAVCLSSDKTFTELPEDDKTPRDKTRDEVVTFEDSKGTWLLAKARRKK